ANLERSGIGAGRGSVEGQPSAAPAGRDRRSVRNTVGPQKVSKVEFPEGLGRRQRHRAGARRQSHRQRTFTLEELVDVQELLGRLRERAQRGRDCPRSAEVAQLRNEGAAGTEPNRRLELRKPLAGGTGRSRWTQARRNGGSA